MPAAGSGYILGMPEAAAGAQGPDTPAGIDAAGWRAALSRTKQRVKQDRVTVSAGSLAYHGFLAFFPAVIAALGILTLVHLGTGTLHHLTHGVAKALPQGAAGVFEGAVRAATRRSSGSLAAVVVGVLVALWSASSAMAVLQQTLDVAYQVPSDRKFAARRVRGVGLMVLTGVFGGLAAALIVFGKPIGSAIGGVDPVGGTAFEYGWTALRWVLAFALVSLLFTSYYYVAPNRRAPRWQWLSPGSVVASAVFLLASLGFSYYISTFGSYGKTYGSFAGVAIFIFWLYLTALAVLLGGELNAALEHEAAAGTPSATTGGFPGRTVATARRGGGGAAVGEPATRVG